MENKVKYDLTKNREEFLRISKEYFDEHGIELTTENGEQLAKDLEVHELGLEEGWSVNVFILTEFGISEAYYRGRDKQFTRVGGPLALDLYLKDVNLVSNKFLHDIDNLIPLIKHLKVR